MVELFPDRLTQIRAFGIIDFIVQAGTLFSQLFLTGCLAERLGGRMLLAIVPLLICIGLIELALAPSCIILTVLMTVRRIDEYAFARPGREMLFAPLDAESKYKANSVIDIVVYRAVDAISGWVNSALDMLGQVGGLLAVVSRVRALL